MTAPAFTASSLDSIESLRAAGFEGFATVGDLTRSGCLEVPTLRGVYIVVREPADPPKFMPGSAAGFYRGQKPRVKVEVLEQHWVPEAVVLYVGLAAGTGVRGKLQQRIKRYLRHGRGKSVGHWSGRYIWQLADHRKLRLAWLPSEDGPDLEAQLLARFEKRYGTWPFANLEEDHDAEENDEE